MIKRHVKATNMDMTEAISDYLERKITGLEKFVQKIDNAIARVEVGRTTNHHHKGEVFKAEIHFEYGDHKFMAKAESTDLYKAIDKVKDELTSEVTKASRKGRKLLKTGKQKIKEMMKKS